MDTKKERRRKPPLRVEVLELRIWWTADPPWPFQLRPDPQFSASGLRSRDFYSRLISRRLSVFRFHRVAPVSSSVSRTCAPFTSRLFRLALSELWTFPLPKLLLVLDRPKPELPRSLRPSISVNCFQSVDLVRLAPPGVYLKGSRLPFESPFIGTTDFCRARSG